MNTSRWVKRAALVAVLVVSASGVVAGSVARPTRAGADTAVAAAVPVTVSKTVTRDHKNADGTDAPVESDTVTATVAQTQSLRGRQQVDVSWTGAHPTGGISADPNGRDAPKQEYPFVVMQCRGTSAQVTPQTCWTQSAPERYQSSFGDAFPPWRLDRNASAADRAALPNVPTTLSPTCIKSNQGDASEHWLPFLGADGTSYDGGAGVCLQTPPEASQVDNDAAGSLPSNTTYAATSATGAGTTKFDMWTSQENASLGCSSTVPCSLVMIPIVGISCDVASSGLTGDDAAAADAECRDTGDYQPGQIANPSFVGADNLAVTGYLWWSASNWNNRLTVPLTFSPAANLCSVTNSATALTVYGSELLTEASTQWEPHFCLDPKLFNFQHVQTSEPEARTLLGIQSVDAAFGSQPYPTGNVPVVQAPVAVTGFAISYTIDDAKGHEYTTLRLDARLLAKLITESYPADNVVYSDTATYGSNQGGSDIANNPVDITVDPEFVALNPGLSDATDTEASSTLIGLNVGSDVTNALTSYINDDPEARAWLNGEADPWGMRVNANYRNIALPVDELPLLDGGIPASFAGNPGLNQCLHDSPVPYLPLIEAPLNSLYAIAESVQFAIPNSTTQCNIFGQAGSGAEELTTRGKQTVGHRFMIGVTSLGEAHRYGLDTAALQTRATPAAQRGQFADGAGRTFVAPSDASLRSTGSLLVHDDTAGVWPIPYAGIRTGSQAATAYPGTMVVYADIPAQGLPASEALDYATLLRFIAGPGQTAGLSSGQLPPGYLPMTAANGLGALASTTLSAADTIAAEAVPTPPQAADAADSSVPDQAPGNVVGPSLPAVAPDAPAAAAPTSPSPDKVIHLAANSSKTPQSSASLFALAVPVLLLALLVGGGTAASVAIRPRLRPPRLSSPRRAGPRLRGRR